MTQTKASDRETDAFADLRGAVRRRFGEAARIEDIGVATLGGSNRTVIFDLVEGAARRRLVSRQETYSGAEKMFLSPADQFRILQIVHRHGFPVPTPVFAYEPADAMGPGYVTAFVGGETMPKTIIHSPQFAALRPDLAGRCGALLAQLHDIDAAEFAFLGAVPDSTDPVKAFLARYDFYGERHPALELGFRWLERHRPPLAGRKFLHGDFRCGNLLMTPDGIAAVLDWECAHLGDPMEDLGWLCTRSWRFDRPELPVGGFGARQDLFAGYERAGGAQIDRDAVRFWEIFGLVRWAIYNIMQAYGHVAGGRRSVAFAACGRNTSLVEYDLLMTLAGHYD